MIINVELWQVVVFKSQIGYMQMKFYIVELWQVVVFKYMIIYKIH